MRLTETRSARGAMAPAALLLAPARAERAHGTNTQITVLEFGRALLERDVGLPEYTQAGNRVEPV